MRRLYVQIYLAFVGILILFGILVSISWFLFASDLPDRNLAGVGRVLGDVLPGPDRPGAELEAALQRLSDQLRVNIALWGSDGALLAYTGRRSPQLRQPPRESGWTHWRGRGRAVALRLPDGRLLLATLPHDRHGYGWLVAIGMLALAIAIGAYPIVRRITRRLERLQQRVDALGGGDLSARVQVEGADEVADLARSFNRAADRIEQLVDAQRNTLAAASHELRTPLTRIRMAVELLAGEERPEIRERVARDTAELDELIDELLMASRLDAQPLSERNDDVDLIALLAEEAARIDADVSGSAVHINGNLRMLRRLVRNLLENARRHAAGARIEATVGVLASGDARIRIADRGPGVPEAERERIFEPFYRPPGMAESGDRGVGLGLALVRRIARHHGGDAHCFPREGGGTCFEVDLKANT